MKKFLYSFIVIFIAGAVYCFYSDRFMTAYMIIFFLIAILTAIGRVYSIDNSIYQHKYGTNDHYDLWKNNQKK